MVLEGQERGPLLVGLQRRGQHVAQADVLEAFTLPDLVVWEQKLLVKI